MITVVYVHAFNFDDRYLWPGRPFTEAMSFPNFLQVLIANGLFRFGIPLFFLRSGFLMAETEGRYTPITRLRKRFQTLVLPYLLWSLVGTFITYAWEANSFTAPFAQSAWLRPFNNLPVHEWSFWQWIESVLLQPISFQLWFLRSLFVYSLLYPLLVLGINRFPIWIFVFFGLAWLLSLGAFFLEGEGLLFFSLGIWLQKRGFSSGGVSHLVHKLRLWWWLPVLLLVKTWYSFQEYPIPIGYFLHKAVQPLLVLAVWDLYDRVFTSPGTSFLDKLSPYNFYIYGFHVPILYFATDLVLSILGREDYIRGAVYIFLPLVVMAIAWALGAILKQLYLPAFKLFTGGRT